MAISTPNPVATPLPPLNFSQTGNMWPTTAATPQTSMPKSPSTKPPSNTAATPFTASSSNVAAASPRRPVRNTLVAPMLPEPILRMSPAPIARVISSPNGMLPSR